LSDERKLMQAERISKKNIILVFIAIFLMVKQDFKFHCRAGRKK